ncbi:MAG: hypothetical protein ACLGG5_10635, partial [Thermoleophilia bacterium]
PPPPPPPPPLAIQLAADATLVGQLEQDPRLLHAAANAGAAATYEVLTGTARDIFGEFEEPG